MPHWSGLLIIAVIAIVIFGGRGKISSIMGDMGKGISAFRKGLKDNAVDGVDAADEALDVTPKNAKSKSGSKSKR